MFSQSVEYALRAIVIIARHDGVCCTAKRISEIAEIPAPYLSKMMRRLVLAGLVSSKRGIHGGFMLSTSPTELTIWDVVDAVEPMKRIHECPLRIGRHAGVLCPLHRRLDDATAMVEKSLRMTTVEELLSQTKDVMPLCETEKLLQVSANKAATLSSQTESKPKKGKADD